MLNQRMIERNRICEGCFGRDESLTPKLHYHKIWTKDHIELEPKFFETKDQNGNSFPDWSSPIDVDRDSDGKPVIQQWILMRCKYCSKMRQMSLTEVSYSGFLEDWNNEDINLFTLMKDFPDPEKQKYFVKVAGYNKDWEKKTLDLGEISS